MRETATNFMIIETIGFGIFRRDRDKQVKKEKTKH